MSIWIQLMINWKISSLFYRRYSDESFGLLWYVGERCNFFENIEKLVTYFYRPCNLNNVKTQMYGILNISVLNICQVLVTFLEFFWLLDESKRFYNQKEQFFMTVIIFLSFSTHSQLISTTMYVSQNNNLACPLLIGLYFPSLIYCCINFFTRMFTKILLLAVNKCNYSLT